MSDTRVADVLDELYDLLAADSTLAALVTSNRLRIFDGPPVSDFAADSMLVVGGVAEVEDDTQTEVSWDWSSLGVSGALADVDEFIDVPCGIASKRGANDPSSTIRALRRSAINIYAAAASAIRGSTLGIDQVMWCTCAVSSIKQMQTADGPECLIRFTARVRTRI
jgi:hypothetical protein